MSPNFDFQYSVLMSVYSKDQSQFLDIAIESMVGQTLPFLDMVIVCDGPLSDKLNQCLEKWANRLGDRLTLLRLPSNGGLGRALSMGLPLCKSNIIARMDSDDISRPNRCEKLLAFILENGLDLAGGAIEEFDSYPGDLGSVRMPPLAQDDIQKRLATRNPFNHVSVMFKRESVLAAGGYRDFPWLEDYWLWARMIASGCRCANLPDVLVDVRVGHGMYSRRANRAYLISQFKLFRKLYDMRLMTVPQLVTTLTARTAACVLPKRFLKLLYKKILRTA